MTPERWAQIDRIHAAAIDRPMAERAAYLDEACAGDPALRREVESLLAYASAAETFLDQPAVQKAAAVFEANEPLAADAPPIVPGYTVLQVLGAGGMGIVYLAEQDPPLSRRVALKLIRPGLDSKNALARFEAERRALALMDHPNIAAVFGTGVATDGRPFVAMELVAGVPITEYCDRLRLSVRARLDLFGKVCAGVQHAHQKGVIHRDLKPSNVLVTEQDNRPVPKVIDFGTATLADRLMARGLGLTEAGTIVGTLEYMSPEQAALSADIDTASDVYSLGILLYELLVGKVPFDRRQLQAAGYDEMRRIIQESDPPRPSAHLAGGALAVTEISDARASDVRRLARELTGDLDWIVLRGAREGTATPVSDGRRLRGGHRTVSHRPGDRCATAVSSLSHREVRAQASGCGLGRCRTGCDSHRRNHSGDCVVPAGRTGVRGVGYRNYVMTINLADSEIRASQFEAAVRQRLNSIPSSRRGWEWEHLFLQTDTSLFTLVDDGQCVNPPNGRPFPVRSSLLGDPTAPGSGWQLGIDRLTLSPDDSRIYLRQCGCLTHWDTATFSRGWVQGTESWLLVGATTSGFGLATSRSGESWNLTLVDLQGTRPARTIGAVDREPICLDMSADGSLLAVGLYPVTDGRRSIRMCSRSGTP